MNTQMPSIQTTTISGGQIEYCLSGAGPTILVSHGTLGGLDQGYSISRLFNQRAFRFLCVSRAGYCNSSPNTGQTTKQQAQSYKELLDAEGIDKVAIIGVSGGSLSAIQFAQDYPERCWGLILLSSISKTPELPPFFKLAVKMQDITMRVDWPWQFIHKYGVGLLARANGVSATQVRVARQDPNLWSIIDGMYGSIKTSKMRRIGFNIDDAQIQSLSAGEVCILNLPIYISHAKNDPLAPFDDAKSFAAQYSQATFNEFSDGGHIFFAIHHESAIPDIEQFLMSHQPTRIVG